MADELERYRQILERKDEEFRRTMEAELSTLSFPRFNSKCRILAGMDIIAHSSMNFAVFK